MKKDIDVTENIASGNVDHIISLLKRLRESGYDRLYWDGYDSSIHLYKSNNQPERPNPEAIDCAWIKWKDLEPPKDIKGIFIKFDDDRIWTDAHYRGSDEYRIKTVGDAKPVSWTFMERTGSEKTSKQC